MSIEYRYLPSFTNFEKSIDESRLLQTKMEEFEEIVVKKSGDFVTSDEKFLERSMGDRLIATKLERLANEQMMSNIIAILHHGTNDLGLGDSFDEEYEKENKAAVDKATDSLQRALDSYILHISENFSDD
jgi:hypothetical protein